MKLVYFRNFGRNQVRNHLHLLSEICSILVATHFSILRFWNSWLISRRSCLEQYCIYYSSRMFSQDILSSSTFGIISANNFHQLNTPILNSLTVKTVFGLLLQSEISDIIFISEIESVSPTSVGILERLGGLEEMIPFICIHLFQFSHQVSSS